MKGMMDDEMAEHPKKHMGFEAAAEQAAHKAGVSMERGRAMIAAGARNASPAAIKANPRLKRVKGRIGKPKHGR